MSNEYKGISTSSEQSSLAGGVVLSPEEKLRQEEKNELRQKYRRMTVVLVGIIVVALGTLLITQIFPRHPEQLEWSEWMEELPEYASNEYYNIEEQTLYSSRNLETTTTIGQSELPGWELYDSVEGTGEFGAWSDWATSEVVGSENREIETQPFYRYRDKVTTTNDNSTLDGWELSDTTYTWSDYGGWSDWSTSAASQSDSREVDTKTQYSYRDRSYTSSSQSSLSGWTMYDYYSSYGSWSDWSDTPISSSRSRDVETREVETGKSYYIAHYCTGNTGDDDRYKSGNWKYHDNCDYHELGWFSSLDSFEVNGSQVTYYPNGSKYRCSNTCWIFYIMGTDTQYKTQYRWRDVSTTYYFYQWGDWSSYSDNSISSNNDREVTTRTLYRYRDRTEIPTYHFWKWGDWTEWTAEQIAASDTRQIETTPYYRYRDRMLETTYYFRRWSEWSGYSTNAVVPNETTEVETIKQYRFKSKN